LSADGVKGILIYLLVYTFMNLGAFGVITSLRHKKVIGDELDDLNGLYSRAPVEAVLMLVFMLSLAGIPPLAGFWGKYFIFAAAVNAGLWPLAVIGENVTIGPRGRIGAMVVIGDGVEIGRDVRIGPHASLSHTLIGDRVYIYPGARIGQDGFGFAITAEGFHTVPQLGRVLIEDDVEVGANTTIDRGTLEDTVIGAGTRIDNLVQIGHNVRIGRACVIVAQVGISGSTVLEDQVVLAGQSGVAGHMRIGTGSRIGAQAGVMADVPPRSELVGSPAQPVKAFFKEVATIRRWIRDGGGPAANRSRGAKPNPDVD